jgi:hypothetical protein
VTVSLYRIYRLADNHIVGVPKTAEYDSDHDVTKYAKEILDGLDLEVWDGPGVVIRLKSTDPKVEPSRPRGL